VRKRLRALQDQLVEAATGQKIAGQRGVVLAVTPRGKSPVPLLIEGADLSGSDPAHPDAHLVETDAFLDLILPEGAIGARRRASSLSPARALPLAMLWTMLHQGYDVS
jgi:hypothetical protein